MATNITVRRTQSQPLIIDGINIRQEDGLYSLNDLHKAAGGESKHQPALFIRLEQTKALINEINSTDMQSLVTVQGRNGGTYVCKLDKKKQLT